MHMDLYIVMFDFFRVKVKLKNKHAKSHTLNECCSVQHRS